MPVIGTVHGRLGTYTQDSHSYRYKPVIIESFPLAICTVHPNLLVNSANIA